MARRMEWRGAGVDARVVFGMGQCHRDGACAVRAPGNAMPHNADSYQISPRYGCIASYSYQNLIVRRHDLIKCVHDLIQPGRRSASRPFNRCCCTSEHRLPPPQPPRVQNHCLVILYPPLAAIFRYPEIGVHCCQDVDPGLLVVYWGQGRHEKRRNPNFFVCSVSPQHDPLLQCVHDLSTPSCP